MSLLFLSFNAIFLFKLLKWIILVIFTGIDFKVVESVGKLNRVNIIVVKIDFSNKEKTKTKKIIIIALK